MSLQPVHDHVYLGRAHDANRRKTLWVVALTTVMMVGEIIAGYLTGSMALLADGFHMATDAGALAVTAAAYAFARKHAHNRAFSFGTGKVGDLAGFASALVLGVISLGIAWESLWRLLKPASVAFTEAIWVAVIGLVVNVASVVLLSADGHHDHDHDHQGHGHGHGHDNNMKSAYMHVVADAFTSVLAIAALLAGRYAGWVWLDPVMGVVGGIVIGRWAWSLMTTTAGVLLDKTDDALAGQIRALVETPGDASIVDLHVWRVGPEAHAAIVSVTGQVDGATVRERLKPVHEVAHLTVETWPPEAATA